MNPAFELPARCIGIGASTTTELRGLRTFLKTSVKRRRRRNKKFSRGTDGAIEVYQSETMPSSKLDNPIAYGPSNSELKSVDIESSSSVRGGNLSPPSTSTTNPEVDSDQVVSTQEEPISPLSTERSRNDHGVEGKNDDLDKSYFLAPVEEGRVLSKLEQEFRDMLVDFSQFTKRDIQSVQNPRFRALFEGVAASYDLPEVYRAFEVLFEDYAAMRIAGRLIYSKLKQVMMEAQRARKEEVHQVSALTGMSEAEVEVSRAAFLQIVVHMDDGATEMTLQQLLDLGLADTVVELMGYTDLDDFLDSADYHPSNCFGFVDLMMSLQSCAIDSPNPGCNPSLLLQEVASRLDERGSGVSIEENRDMRKARYTANYNNMVKKFREWKQYFPEGDSRRLDILRGCFVGAESDEIVNALRIVYLDYSALRLSGDLIFKIMEALNKRQRK